jgi:hypothetical protein
MAATGALELVPGWQAHARLAIGSAGEARRHEIDGARAWARGMARIELGLGLIALF